MKAYIIALLLLTASLTACQEESPEQAIDYQAANITELETALLSASDQEQLKLYWELYKKTDSKEAEKVISYMDALETVAKSIDNKEYIGKANFAKAYIHHQNADYTNAIQSYEEAIASLKEAGHNKLLGIVMNNIANIYENVKDYEQAVQYRIESLKYYQQLEDQNKMAMIYFNLGYTNRKAGQYPEAIAHLSQAIELYQELGKELESAETYNAMGAVYYDMGQYAKGREYYTMAQPQITDIALNNIGETYLAEKDYQKAKEVLTEAWKYKEANNANNESKAETLVQLGQLAQAQGSELEAVRYFGEAVALTSGTYSPLAKQALGLAMASPAREEAKMDGYLQLLNELHSEELAIREKLSASALAQAHRAKVKEIAAAEAQEANVLRTRIAWTVAGLLLAMVGAIAVVHYNVRKKKQELSGQWANMVSVAKEVKADVFPGE